MTTIHDDEARPGGASRSIQFQALTFFVWIGAVTLLIAGAKRAQKGYLDPTRLLMPAIHLVPWCIALVGRRSIRTLPSLTEQNESLIEKVSSRVLWAAYLTLTLVEYWLY